MVKRRILVAFLAALMAVTMAFGSAGAAFAVELVDEEEKALEEAAKAAEEQAKADEEAAKAAEEEAKEAKEAAKEAE